MPVPTLRDILPPSPEKLQQDIIGDNQLYRGFTTGIKGITSGSLANDALNAELRGAQNADAMRREALASQQEAAAYAPRVGSLRDIGGVGGAFDYAAGALGQGVASMAPSLAAAALARIPGAGAGLSRLSSYAGAAGAGYLQEKGEAVLGQYSDPVLAATSAQDRSRAATTKAVINAALEGIVPAGLTRMAGKNGLGRILAKDAVTESATEAAQQYVGHLANKSLDPNRQLDPWDIADAFVGGALTGGTVGAVHGLVHTPKDFVGRTTDSIIEAGKNAPTPQDFLKAVFKGNPTVKNDPVAAGDMNPELVDAIGKVDPTSPEAGTILDDFTAKRNELAKQYAEELLNDENTPAAVRQQVVDMQGKYDDPNNQVFLGTQYVGRRAGEAASTAAEFVKTFAERATKAVKKATDTNQQPSGDAPLITDGTKKKNLQSPVTPDEEFSLHKDIIDNLTPAAKRRTDIIRDIPQIASGVSGIINKMSQVGAAPTEKNIAELQQLYYAATTLFADPAKTLKQLSDKLEMKRADGKKITPFMDLLAGVTTAQQDVAKNEGGSYLQARLVTPMGQEQVAQLAKFVDEFGMTDMKNSKQADKVLDGLAVAFGGKQEALQVLDYYSKANKLNAKQLLQYDENEVLDPESGMSAKELVPTKTYSFADQKSNRPFLKGEGVAKLDAKSLREGKLASDSAKVSTIPYSQYVEETGKDARGEVKRIMNDVKSRHESALLGYADELGVKGDKAAKLAMAYRFAAEQRPSPNPKSTRLASINKLQNELDVAREAFKQGGDKAVLDRYEVNSAEQNEKDDLTATDEDIKAMATNKYDEDMVAFTKADGSKMVLSSQSMMMTQAAKEKGTGAARGEPQNVREQRLMKEAIASVLAREDIKSMDEKTTPPSLVQRGRSDDTKAALKEQEASIAELKKRTDEATREYEDNNDEESRDSIRIGIERNISRLQSQYEAAEGQAPRRAVIRQRQAVYKEALAAINDVDFQEKIDQREKDGPDMATTRTEPEGARQYEEDTGLRIGDEKRSKAEDRVTKNSFVGAKYFPESHKSAEKFFAGEPTQAEKDKVFTEQGWFKGPDGKLRREISPTAMAEAFRKSLVDGLTSPMLGTTRIERANFSLNLGDIMKAASSRMYEAYGKDLGDVHVQIGVHGDVGPLGSYDYKEKQMVIDPLAVAQQLAVRATGKKDVIAAKASGQITDKQIVDLVVSTFMHEFQHAIQRAEGFEGGGNLLVALISAYGTAAEKKEYRELIAREDDIDSFEASADRQHILKTRINSRFYATLKPGEDPRKAAYDLYRRLTGEAEAHNVQDRLDLTPEERRTVKPVLTRKEEFAKIWFINSFLNDVAASIVKSSKQDAREAGPANATPKDQQEALDEIDNAEGIRYYEEETGNRIGAESRRVGKAAPDHNPTPPKPGLTKDQKKALLEKMRDGVPIGEDRVFKKSLQGVGIPSDKLIDAVYDVVHNENYSRLDTPEKALAFARAAKQVLEHLNKMSYTDREAKYGEDRSDELVGLRNSLEEMFNQSGYVSFDWNSLVSEVDGSEADIKEMERIVKSSKQDKAGRTPGAQTFDQISRDEVIAEIARIRGKDVAVAFATFADIGGSGDFSMNRDKSERLIRIAVDAANMKSVAWHESLHDFIAMLGGTPEERKIKRDMLQATNTPAINARLRELLKDHPEALKQLDDPEERLAYVYQFWAEGVLELTPKADTIMGKVATFIRTLLGIVSSEGKLEAQFAALHRGEMTEPSTVAKVIADLDAQTIADKLQQLAGPLADGLSRVFTSATERLRKHGIEELDQLADLFHRDPGHEKGRTGMLQRRAQKEGQFNNALQSILEGTTAAERKTALKNMQDMKPPSSELETKLKDLLKTMYNYMIDAGVQTYDGKNNEWKDVGYVDNYFPRNWDGDAIRRDEAKFKALLQANNVSPEQVKAIYNTLVFGGSLDMGETDKSLGFIPQAVHIQDRLLTFIDKSNAHLFSEFQNQDLTDIMTTYIRQASHRAEYARSFGNKGEVIQALLKSARANGLTKEEEESLLPTIRGLEGTLGHDMNPAMKHIMGGIMTMENVLLMPMAIFSQFIDPLNIAMRTSNVKDAGHAYLQALKDLKRFVTRDKSTDTARELAKMLGIISTDNMLEAMGQTQGSMYMTKTMRDINRQFFRYNGMEGWNNSMRIAATVAGERYLLDNRSNERALEELGVDAKYIMETTSNALVPNGTKASNVGRMAITKQQFEGLGLSADEAQKAAEQIQEAMFRFVDGAVVRPNAAHRATWMSDPRFQLVSHLKQFTYSFQAAVLARAKNEYLRGNAVPITLLAASVPVMFAADMAKWLLTGTTPKNWTFFDYFTHAVTRSGALGKYEYAAKTVEDAARGRMPGISFAGPTAEHATLLAQSIAGAPGASTDKLISRTIPLARYA